MKEKTITRFECSICGTLYEEETQAIQCEERGTVITKYRETLKPWNWYLLKSKNSDTIRTPFIGHVSYHSHYKYDSICYGKIQLHDYLWNQYYEIPDYEVLEVLSPRQAFEKCSLLINFKQKNDMGNIQYLSPKYKMPESVAIEMDELITEIKNNYVKELVFSLSPEQLAQKILSAENSIFGDNFSFKTL